MFYLIYATVIAINLAIFYAIYCVLVELSPYAHGGVFGLLSLMTLVVSWVVIKNSYRVLLYTHVYFYLFNNRTKRD